MKRIFFLIILMHINVIIPRAPAFAKASADASGETPGTIILNINLSNVDKSRMVNDARVDTQQNLNQFEKNSENASLAIQDMKSFIMDNFKAYKWHIAGVIALSSYGLLCYYIIKGNSYLKQTDLWSSWRKELTIDDLLAISQQKFAQDLSQEIYHRYNTDFATSVVLFIKALEQEEKDLRWYQSLYDWLSRFYMLRLTPCDKKLYEQISQRLQRIAYYKGCIEHIVYQTRYCI